MQETSCALKIFTPSLAKSAITLPCQTRQSQMLALKPIEDMARGLGERGKDFIQEFFPGEENWHGQRK